MYYYFNHFYDKDATDFPFGGSDRPLSIQRFLNKNSSVGEKQNRQISMQRTAFKKYCFSDTGYWLSAKKKSINEKSRKYFLLFSTGGCVNKRILYFRTSFR